MSNRRIPRNPGPPLGYQLLWLGHRLLPHWLFYPIVKAGTIIAVIRMRRERRASREYLRIVLGREPRFADILNHFFAQVCSLIEKIVLTRIEDTAPLPAADPQTQEFFRLAQSDEQTLFGTFHIGASDMIGASLCALGRKVYMVRQKVRNAPDLAVLKRVAGNALEFVWVNDPRDITFAIHRLLADGASLALQCDRIEFGSKHRAFRFLGKERLFPVTIYHLAHLFQLPVGFALAVPGENGEQAIVSSGVFRPHPTSREATLESGCAHFQRTLDLLEQQLYRHPFIWFNFLPLNPEPQKNAGANNRQPVQQGQSAAPAANAAQPRNAAAQHYAPTQHAEGSTAPQQAGNSDTPTVNTAQPCNTAAQQTKNINSSADGSHKKADSATQTVS